LPATRAGFTSARNVSEWPRVLLDAGPDPGGWVKPWSRPSPPRPSEGRRRAARARLQAGRLKRGCLLDQAQPSDPERAMEYAVKHGTLRANPLPKGRGTTPRHHRRWTSGPSSTLPTPPNSWAGSGAAPAVRRLHAFLATLYYTGPRPEEAVAMRHGCPAAGRGRGRPVGRTAVSYRAAGGRKAVDGHREGPRRTGAQRQGQGRHPRRAMSPSADTHTSRSHPGGEAAAGGPALPGGVRRHAVRLGLPPCRSCSPRTPAASLASSRITSGGSRPGETSPTCRKIADPPAKLRHVFGRATRRNPVTAGQRRTFLVINRGRSGAYAPAAPRPLWSP
jgi:hypothetical protein